MMSVNLAAIHSSCLWRATVLSMNVVAVMRMVRLDHEKEIKNFAYFNSMIGREMTKRDGKRDDKVKNIPMNFF